MSVGKVTFTKAEREKLAEVLCLLNWISVVTGAILLGMGLFLKVEIQKWQEVMSEQGVLYVPHMLITTGLAACGINFLGGKICLDCTDTNKFLRWKLVMMPYVVCTFFFTACILAGALMCFSIRSQLEESLFLGLRHSMRYYKDTDTPGRCYLKRTLDLLQIQFQCCGNSGYQDWFQIQWISSRYLDLRSMAVVKILRYVDPAVEVPSPSNLSGFAALLLEHARQLQCLTCTTDAIMSHLQAGPITPPPETLLP